MISRNMLQISDAKMTLAKNGREKKVKEMDYIRRGDIFYILDVGENTGDCIRKDRPGIIVSNDAINKSSPNVEVVCLTTKEKPDLPTHVLIMTAQKPSTALCEEVMTVPKQRLGQWVGKATLEEMQEINKAIIESLALKGREKGMEVKIEINNKATVFEMNPEKAVELFRKAMLDADTVIDEEEKAAETPEPPKASPLMRPQHRRTDSLFGEDWKTAAIEKVTEAEETQESRESAPAQYPEAKQGYYGFLMIECDHCGEVKAFCAEEPISDYRCRCGGLTPLTHLKKMFLECECGKIYKYRTNLEDEIVEHNCLNCGNPVAMQLNSRRNLYTTIRG